MITERHEIMNKYTYTCPYCGTVYKHFVKECEHCGSAVLTETIETTASGKTLNKTKKTLLFIISGIIGVLILMTLFTVIQTSIDDTLYSDNEYSFDSISLNDKNLYIGKHDPDADIDYYKSFRITGSFNDLYSNIYENIYTSQFQFFDFDIPCNIEIKNDNFAMDITGLSFYYYSSLGYITPVIATIGSTDFDISMYLIDKNGNKNKLLIETYSRDKYVSVTEYLFSDAYKKEFTINPNLEIYESIMIEYGNTSETFAIDYDRATGYIQYYGLKN